MRLNIKEIEKKMDAIISDVWKAVKKCYKMVIFSSFKGFFLVFCVNLYSNGRFFAIFL